MSGRRVAVAVVLIGAVAAGGYGIAQSNIVQPQADPRGLNEIAGNGTVQGRLYPGDSTTEPQLVDAEEQRIALLREIASSVPWEVEGIDGAYRVPIQGESTLMLTARPEPYTVDDLAALTPENVTSLPDGSLLLAEDVVVTDGAILTLGGPDAMTLRLASSADGFTSVVSLGGQLNLAGTPDAPLTVSSWDPASGSLDTFTDDGRAYIRSIGGTVTAADTTIQRLGFWSGNTGGFAVSGLDAQRPPSESTAPVAAQEGAPTLTPGEVTAIVDARGASAPTTVTITNVTVEGNAYGIFVANVSGVTISGSRVSASLIDGITFHRAVTDSAVVDTVSEGNAVDGVSIVRSSENITIDGVTARSNGRNGISIDAQPLADGPSALGTAVASFGGHSVVDSVSVDNGRYGIEVSGGTGAIIEGNRLAGNESGIVIDDGAAGPAIRGNTVDGAHRQGISLRDGVTEARVESNTVNGAATAIYLRNAQAVVTDNVISDASSHGVTVAGTTDGARVLGNDIGGSGGTAIRYDPESGASIGSNTLDRWDPAPTTASVLRAIFQPLTIVWLLLALLVVITAVPAGRRSRAVRNPFENRVPLTVLSAGAVQRDSMEAPR